MPADTRPGSQLLRIQVYDYLQEQMRTRVLEPGAAISVSQLGKELGVSRTPLREALLILQEQGFVTIMPQRGVLINAITTGDVNDIYEILGGIESRILLAVYDRIGQAEIARFEACNRTIEQALAADDIVRYNTANVDFHDVFLNLSANERMRNYVKKLKLQLYDFPRRDYGRQWNERNLEEHRQFLHLLKEDRAMAAANYLRDVHWACNNPDSFTILPG
ncbi:MAG: GntR family transcriptional regulator [Deltaproteobacteria bacterium]|nr:MAG: GntR family transcriptional regulator [Deltaproteobacteria bacterium]